MTMRQQVQEKRRYELIVLIGGCLLLGAAIVFGSGGERVDETVVLVTLPPSEISEEVFEPVPAISEEQDYSRFQHRNPTHSRMPCLLCHKREDNSATPKFSGHVTCAGCHAQQFADSGSQICSVCHTNAQSGALKRFPGLKSFNSRFDHGRHVRQTGCATCHKPSRRGVALSVPAGRSAHNSCFQCHGPGTEVGGRNIGTCSTCHQAGRPTRNSDWSAAYSKNFDHSEHRVAKLSCNNCHTVRAGMPRGRQVTSPVPAMHFASTRSMSCATCHNNKRAFGGTDFADCKRCHQGTTFRF
jgi:c(7)-type cytochrome triheme protein